jgi:hypothetical protein
LSDVSTPSAAYQEMAEKWTLARTLLCGTTAMRAAAELYLPRYHAESPNVYQDRLKRAVLTNFFKRAIRTLTGKVFSNPVNLGEDATAEFEAWAEDIDMCGNNLHAFSEGVFKAALADGLTHVLTEFPKPLGPTATLADERQAGRRPYLVHVKAERLLYARRKIVNGRERLTHVRIYEPTDEPVDEFEDATKERIRVYDADLENFVRWRLFEKMEKDEWIVIDEGDIRPLIDIPLVTFYTDRTGFMTAEPPLEDLAHLNVLHWQSAADHHNCLTYARFPIFSAVGVPDEERENIVIGPSAIVGTANPEAKIGYLEHTGKALETGRTEIKDIEEKMELMALEPLLRKASGSETATARAIDTAEAHSALQSWALGLQDVLEQALMFAGQYVNVKPPSAVINTDFGLSLDQAKDIEALIKMRAMGDISRETLWSEMKRRNVLQDSFEPEAEIERISAEGPALSDTEEEEQADSDAEIVR